MSAVPQIPPESRSSAAASQDRRIQMLRTAMGPLIAAALEDPDVVEVMLNPDRTLWVDRLSSGRAPLGVELPEADLQAVSMGCFDYEPYGELLRVPVHMVRQRHRQLIARAYELLESQPAEPELITVKPELYPARPRILPATA